MGSVHQSIRRQAAAAFAVCVLGITATPTRATVGPSVGPFPGPFEIPAQGSYAFAGNCLDCPAPSAATATLEIGPGPSIYRNSSFEYSSSLFTLTSTNFEFIWGDLSGAPGPKDLYMYFADQNNDWWFFQTEADGDWNLSLGNVLTLDFGNQGVWANAVVAVPEPSTYALMALGLGALGLVSCRRRQAA